jgi:hypothetical protein
MQINFKIFPKIEIIPRNLLKFLAIGGDHSPIYQKKACDGQPLKKPTQERQYGGFNQKMVRWVELS